MIQQSRNADLYKSESFCIKSTEAYPEPCKISKMKCFAKVVNGKMLLSIFAKRFILNV